LLPQHVLGKLHAVHLGHVDLLHLGIHGGHVEVVLGAAFLWLDYTRYLVILDGDGRVLHIDRGLVH